MLQCNTITKWRPLAEQCIWTGPDTRRATIERKWLSLGRRDYLVLDSHLGHIFIIRLVNMKGLPCLTTLFLASVIGLSAAGL